MSAVRARVSASRRRQTLRVAPSVHYKTTHEATEQNAARDRRRPAGRLAGLEDTPHQEQAPNSGADYWRLRTLVLCPPPVAAAAGTRGSVFGAPPGQHPNMMG